MPSIKYAMPRFEIEQQNALAWQFEFDSDTMLTTRSCICVISQRYAGRKLCHVRRPSARRIRRF